MGSINIDSMKIFRNIELGFYDTYENYPNIKFTGINSISKQFLNIKTGEIKVKIINKNDLIILKLMNFLHRKAHKDLNDLKILIQLNNFQKFRLYSKLFISGLIFKYMNISRNINYRLENF
jgi:hypothetical protein